MAQNITLLGASYSDVPSVELPKTGGGTAQFDDTTIASNAASASDITSGKLAFVNGELVTGTASGGSATLITKSITANGTYNASSDNADGYSSVTVNVSGGGGGGDMSDPIRFFDYDGTLVASYSSVPDSLPDCPTHSGLTSQGWNWTLSEIQAQFNAMGFCDVGHNLVTSDGKTRIYIELVEGNTAPYVGCCPKGTVTIDWGDSSATDTLTGTSLTSAKHKQHTYSAPGKYVISLEATSGTFALYGSSNCSFLLTRNGASSGGINQICNSAINKVELGTSVSLGNYSFQSCVRLESVSIPTSITKFTATGVFGSCNGLKFLALPRGTTNTGASLASKYAVFAYSFPSSLTTSGSLSSLYNISRIVLPNGVTTISSGVGTNDALTEFVIPNNATSLPNNMFSSCRALASLTIPASVTSIGSSAFGSCYGIIEYHFKPTTPPTLANTNAFSNIRSNCVIYVPAASLTDYQTANNWSTYASKMVGE